MHISLESSDDHAFKKTTTKLLYVIRNVCYLLVKIEKKKKRKKEPEMGHGKSEMRP